MLSKSELRYNLNNTLKNSLLRSTLAIARARMRARAHTHTHTHAHTHTRTHTHTPESRVPLI